jgi:dUTP pyrophosphatase
MDLRSVDTGTLHPGRRALVKTGIKIALPEGYEAQIRPRSGLAAKNGVTVLNAPGTIDSDYRGEIMVVLFNAGDHVFNINPGDRIAQMVIAQYSRVQLDEVQSLDNTDRGENGFGSSGTS